MVNADPGDADHFGGNDIDKISDLFSGVADVDTVDINSQTTFRDSKFKVRNPANTFSYTLRTSAISANRNVTLPLLTANDTFVFASLAQTLTNKTFTGTTFDTSSNSFKGFAQDPTGRRWGLYQPNASGSTNATVGTLTGMLAGHTPSGAGTPSNSWDTTEGLVINHVTAATAETAAGIVSPTDADGMLRFSHPAMMRVRCKVDSTSNVRLYFGVSSDAVLPLNVTPLAVGDHGILAGFSSIDTNFTARGNDGTGAGGIYDLGTAKNTNYNTFEINWNGNGTSANVIFNGVTTTITNPIDLPDMTTNMFFHFQVQTTTTTARTVSTKGVWIDAV